MPHIVHQLVQCRYYLPSVNRCRFDQFHFSWHEKKILRLHRIQKTAGKNIILVLGAFIEVQDHCLLHFCN